jgi:hypothetical protein
MSSVNLSCACWIPPAAFTTRDCRFLPSTLINYLHNVHTEGTQVSLLPGGIGAEELNFLIQIPYCLNIIVGLLTLVVFSSSAHCTRFVVAR